MIARYSEGAAVESVIIRQRNKIFLSRIKHLRKGYKAISPVKIQMGYDADDFARNMVSVAMTYYVVKVSRLVANYLLRSINQKFLRARNRKYR